MLKQASRCADGGTERLGDGQVCGRRLTGFYIFPRYAFKGLTKIIL